VSVAAERILVMSAGGDSLVDSRGPAPTVDEADELPCEITLDESVRLVGGGAGFTVLVECSRDVGEPRLSFQGPTRFSKSFETQYFQPLKPGSRWEIFTHELDTFDGYTFIFTAEVGGIPMSKSVRLGGSTSRVSTPSPTPRPQASSGECDSFCQARHCSPSNTLYTYCRECEVCIVDDPTPTPAPTTPASYCSSSCSTTYKSFCSPTSRMYEYCKGCDHCKQEDSALQCSKYCGTHVSFCKSQSGMYKYCAGCSMCISGLSDSISFDTDAKTATCGKYTDCDRSDPAKYCSGWRQKYCGGCSWC